MMKKIMTNLTTNIKNNKEDVYFVGMISGWLLSVGLFLMLLLFMAMCDDLVGRIKQQESQINNLSYDAVRYKLMYEDLYDIYVYPQTQGKDGNNNE